MITIYTSPSCASCRKVKKWFDEQKIPYREKNIFSTALNAKELKDLLSKTENGTDDIISKRSNIIKEKKVDIDDMSINQLVDFIRENPSILKRPIMVDERRVKVGYNEDEITTFIPIARYLAKSYCDHDGDCSKCANATKIDLTAIPTNKNPSN
jgi:regulatory protein spx